MDAVSQINRRGGWLWLLRGWNAESGDRAGRSGPEMVCLVLPAHILRPSSVPPICADLKWSICLICADLWLKLRAALLLEVKEQKFAADRKRTDVEPGLVTYGGAVTGLQPFAVQVELAADQLHPGVAALTELVMHLFAVV